MRRNEDFIDDVSETAEAVAVLATEYAIKPVAKTVAVVALAPFKILGRFLD